MKPFVLLTSLVLLAAPTAAVAGTEVRPEVSDPAGDVAYSPAYVGPRDRDYLDILALWLEYDATNHTVNVTLKVADATGVTSVPNDWSAACGYHTRLHVDGRVAGSLNVNWAKIRGPASIASEIRWHPDGGGFERIQSINHTFAIIDTKPGYYRWVIAYPDLIRHGEAFTGEMIVQCNEYRWVMGPMPFLTPISNYDVAKGEATYSFKEFDRRHLGETGGEYELGDTAAAQADADAPHLSAPGLGIAPLLLLMAASGVLHLRRRRS